MNKSVFTLEHARRLAGDVWELILEGDASAVTAPGQFVNLELPGKFLRRPISVCDWTETGLTLLVKEVGAGTRELVRLPAGTRLDVLTGLGNGFGIGAAPEGAVLVGGGIGSAPLYGLAKRMLAAGRSVQVVLGFRSKEDAFYLEEFAALGLEVRAATEDGSLGTKGFVTDVLNGLPDCRYVLACGPTPMLRAVHALPQITGGQFSFEARMACGFGACVGCTIETRNGLRRVCKDGPVFRKEEILW
ncbi:MAG: dihydroorotate dehydrogenase electron transfer subunit [Oscillibacter sp.]|nr:dihydroorotate dehydrogenase electron transfer subunit [Oscillibacter sp.]